jgi:hypothetical protein
MAFEAGVERWAVFSPSPRWPFWYPVASGVQTSATTFISGIRVMLDIPSYMLPLSCLLNLLPRINIDGYRYKTFLCTKI